MRKLLLSFVLVAFGCGLSWAQERTVTGTVTASSDGTPLPGVSVSIKGTTRGNVTDGQGRYSLAAPDNATLVFSFVGFISQEVAVGGRSSINVALQSDVSELSEIVITGYGTQNKREVSGSVATVKGSTISQMPMASFDQTLQGMAPGILVQANSGQPGSAASILIRGRGSILGNTDPLFIMDGVEISSTDFSTLNPGDFESLTVLKDAASTSIYGSRGANGVIVITTKKGRSGKAQLNYDVQYGASSPPVNRLKLMDSNQKLDYELSRGNPYEWTDEDVARLRQINTNWEDVFFRTGRTASHTLSVSGGSDKTTYFLSGSLFDQTGTVQNTGLRRYTGRVNIESGSGGFTFGLNSTFGYSEFSNTSEANSGLSTPLNAIRWINPYETPYDEDGNFTQMVSGQPNALEELLGNNNLRQQLKGVGNVYAAYEIPFVKGLRVRTSWGGDFVSNENTFYAGPTTVTGRSQLGNQGSFARDYARSFRYTGTTSITYNTQFGEEHTLSVGLFNEIVNSRGRNLGFTGFGLAGAFQNEAGITPGNSTNNFIPLVRGGGRENSLLSYFTEIKYGFRDRYFLNVGARRDGSSRFGENRRFATFGSVGFSWIVTEENFMSGLKNVFNELKYKISYGSSGNQALLDPNGFTLDFASRELYGRSVYNGIGGLTQTQLANPNLQWERKTTFNTGIEFAILKGRLRSSVEYYNSITSSLFLDRQLSRTSGFSSIVTNIGELQNRGVEFSLDGDLVKVGDFTWTANVSLTRNWNKILSLVGTQQEIISGNFINRVGEQMNSLYVVRYSGVNPANGNAQYVRLDGELTETFNPADRVIVGTTEAPFFGGFGTALRFKGFEANAFFSFVSGNVIFNNDRNNVENPAYFFDNMSADLINEWKQPGDITNIPRPGNTYRANTTRFVENGDFLRLRNLNVSYALPTSVLNVVKLRSVRVFAQGQNLFTWTQFRGFDPEITDGSLVGAQYPALRTVTFGLNIGL